MQIEGRHCRGIASTRHKSFDADEQDLGRVCGEWGCQLRVGRKLSAGVSVPDGTGLS